MYNISDSQVDFILDDIKKRGVELEDLQNNLLDHVCCIIENKMNQNHNFNEFYENTISKFYKTNLAEIEEETKNLLTFKNFYAMKRTMKITGIISTIFIILGVFLRLMHWPGSGLLLVVGLPLFGLIFMPLVIALKFKDDSQKKEKIIFSIGIAIGMIGLLGIGAKIMYWPLQYFLLRISFILFFTIFIPIYFINGFKQSDKKFNTIIVTLFMIVGVGVLLSLTTLEYSGTVKRSLLSINQNITSISSNILDSNNNFIKLSTDSNALLIHKSSIELLNEIDNVKNYLIRKSLYISEDAKYTNTDILRCRENGFVGLYYYNFDRSLIKYRDLQKQINEYNSNLQKLIEHPINVDDILVNGTTLAIFIHQLTQIQLQIAINENSYLNYVKGKLSK